MRLVFAALVSTLLLPLQGPTASARFPGRVEQLLVNARFTADDRRQLLAGEAVARALPADGSKELAVFGAAWIRAPIERYVQRLTDIEQFERGGRFRPTPRITPPPRPGGLAPPRA